MSWNLIVFPSIYRVFDWSISCNTPLYFGIFPSWKCPSFTHCVMCIFRKYYRWWSHNDIHKIPLSRLPDESTTSFHLKTSPLVICTSIFRYWRKQSEIIHSCTFMIKLDRHWLTWSLQLHHQSKDNCRRENKNFNCL